MTSPPKNLFLAWDVTLAELNEIINENPNLYGPLYGYVAEYKLRNLWLNRPEITDLRRPRAHDKKDKGDFIFRYKGEEIRLEVKSLDSPKVRKEGSIFHGTFQCNGSDAREITLPNGQRVKTNCLATGQFDVLAVSLFGFERRWKFAFALNRDLPRSTFSKYTPEQRQYLLKSSMQVSWPLSAPFVEEPFVLLDAIVRERSK